MVMHNLLGKQVVRQTGCSRGRLWRASASGVWAKGR